MSSLSFIYTNHTAALVDDHVKGLKQSTLKICACPFIY